MDASMDASMDADATTSSDARSSHVELPGVAVTNDGSTSAGRTGVDGSSALPQLSRDGPRGGR
eukprot:COSAG06_NODE_40940_length_396_cov_8.895623_2_plen_62_part_01